MVIQQYLPQEKPVSNIKRNIRRKKEVLHRCEGRVTEKYRWKEEFEGGELSIRIAIQTL